MMNAGNLLVLVAASSMNAANVGTARHEPRRYELLTREPNNETKKRRDLRESLAGARHTLLLQLPRPVLG